MTFADHFSAVASQYAQYRPRYPEALPAYLAAQAPRRALAWDAGCGTGQFSLSLAKHFVRVHATDASAEQIAQAVPMQNVGYEARRCDDSGLAPGSVDLACVAQAAHWFDLPSYYAEVLRVAAPGALIALISYGNLEQLGDMQDALDSVRAVAAPYWPAERAHVDNAYANLEFPFERMATPRFDMTVTWVLPQLLGYLGTWSAWQRMKAARGDTAPAVEPLLQGVSRAWGNPHQPRTFAFPLGLVLGRVASL